MDDRLPCWWRRASRVLAAVAVVAAPLVAAPPAAAQIFQNLVQISKLSDVGFGTISNIQSDQVRSQSVCAFSGLLGGGYNISASGSGSGGAFTLSNGSTTLPYEVQWSTTAGQTSGTALTAGATLSGQTMVLSCPVFQTTNASLIVILRGTALGSATAGNYNGSLTLILSAN